MTEIQLTKLQLANYVCDELHKEMPFDLIFNQGEFEPFMEIIDASNLDVGFSIKNIGDKIYVGVTKGNSNGIYQALSSYIEEHQKPANNIDQFIQSGEFDKAFRDVFGLPIGVVLSLILVYFTQIFWIDAAVALLFGSYIIFVGYKIVRKSLSGIMDEADPDLLSAIVEVLQRDRKKEWIDIHNMKIQQYGSGLHIDAHITLPWYNDLRSSHQEMENIIKTLIAETERHVEFNFHMDDCKPHSCEICELECLHRQHSFKKKIKWNAESVSQVSKHCMKSNG